MSCDYDVMNMQAKLNWFFFFVFQIISDLILGAMCACVLRVFRVPRPIRKAQTFKRQSSRVLPTTCWGRCVYHFVTCDSGSFDLTCLCLCFVWPVSARHLGAKVSR